MTLIQQPVAVSSVGSWHGEADVIVLGYGLAGACAALEAKRAGADVLVVERASGGGGTSALSSGYFYLGGGTAVQQATGDQDGPEEMYKFLRAISCAADANVVKAYCDGSVEHFNWLEDQGIPFERTAYREKVVETATTECLTSTGNEKVWPYRDIAQPCPRGHRVAVPGMGAGGKVMEILIAHCAKAGVRSAYDSQVVALIVDGARVVGVRVRQLGGNVDFRARKAVIIATGGFSFNEDMLREHVPHVLGSTSEPIGIPYNDGAGIQLGISVGARTQAMDGAMVTSAFYPPGQLLKGILVNVNGERFVAEDSYHGRTAGFITGQPERKAFLILDAEIFAYPEAEMFGHRMIDGWETVADMAAGLNVPLDSLRRTLDEYNRDAAAGTDKRYYKSKEWLKPLSGPYAAFDVSFNKSNYFFFTLGGLGVTARAEVLDEQGKVIDGLYAAGGCASTIPQDAKDYASGLSLGPASFFGRIAGCEAAEQVSYELPGAAVAP